MRQISFESSISVILHTVAVESPESSVATFKPFERVVTLVSGTLYNDCNNGKKSEILIAKLVRLSLRICGNSIMIYYTLCTKH